MRHAACLGDTSAQVQSQRYWGASPGDAEVQSPWPREPMSDHVTLNPRQSQLWDGQVNQAKANRTLP